MRPDAATFLSSNERQALLKSIAHQCRMDGRLLADLRRIRCRFADTDQGCVSVSLGDTLVVAKATHDIVEPWAHRPAEGQLQVNLEVPGPEGTGAAFKLDDEALRAQRALERCFKESRCLDLESLCIVPGERVFLIRVTATVVNNAGNMVDCAAMAVVLALADFRRPDVSLVQGAVRVGESAPVPLSLNFYPVVQTFGLFDSDGKYIVADLSAKEEALAACRVVVAMSASREICCLHTIGGLLLDRRHLVSCVRLAGRRVRCLAQLLDRALANRRLDTLDLAPPLLATATEPASGSVAMATDDVDDNDDRRNGADDGELSSSSGGAGSDMDVVSPSSPQSLATTGAGGHPYSFAVVSGGGAASAGAAARPADTARHVELGLRFIRSAMSSTSRTTATAAAGGDDGDAVFGGAHGGGSDARSYFDVEDDEEEVTMVTHLL